MEWTAYPTEASDPNSGIAAENTDHSIGPTTIDLSLVDGFNVGFEMVPDQDTVCAVSEFHNGPIVFKLFPGDQAMGKFPTDLTTPEDEICPQKYEVTRGQQQIGCYSQCAWANQTRQSQDVINRNCCHGKYDTFPTCNPVIDRSYINNIVKYSEGIYVWAYNDNRGTFTCNGAASFSFHVTDVFDIRRQGL